MLVARAAGVDEVAAHEAVAEAFERAWQQLPAQHSTTRFRPWFLGLVARVTTNERPAGNKDLSELMEGKRGADAAARRILGTAPAWLPAWRSSAPPPTVEPVHMVRAALPAATHAVFATLRDPARVPVWMPGARVRQRSPLEPGSRFTARFGSARSRVLVVAMEHDRRIAYTVTVRTGPFGPAPELRFALELSPEGATTMVAYTLRGIAAPPNGLGRALRSTTDIARETPALMELALGRLDAVLRQGDGRGPATIAAP